MLDNLKKQVEKKCRCYINAGYATRAFKRAGSGLKNYKKCSIHNI
jgi:hypothetical protein